MAGPGDDAESREDSRQGEQQRDPGGDESAERDHEDDERDRERQHPGLAEVLLDGRRDRVDRAGHAELADVELRVCLLGGVDLGENRIELLRRLVGCAADLELDQRRVSVGGDLLRCERSARLSSFESRATTSPTAAVKAGVGRRERAALDQDALRGRALEARVEDPVHPARLARPGGVRVDRLRAGHAEGEGDEDEREPAERRRLPVVGTPAPHPGREVRFGGRCGHFLPPWRV